MVAAALTVAGSDSGGGAGLQADLKTFAALGVYGASVVTAITAQNTRGVDAAETVSPELVKAQLRAVLGDIRIDAVKVGMVGSAPVIEAVAEILEEIGEIPLVIDPVMVATSGDVLLEPDAVDAMRERLLPLATVATPNLPEAGALLGRPAPGSADEVEAAGRDLLALGPRWVLVTGGDGTGDESVDFLAGPATGERYAARRENTGNTHGSGCTLSSAIAAGLARGLCVPRAVAWAKAYVTGAIAAADGLGVGHGRGPLHHFHVWWGDPDGDPPR